MKFSIEKQTLEKLKAVDFDQNFLYRALERTQIEKSALLINELRRVGQANKKIKVLDLDKGEIEVEAIELAKDINGPIKT